MELDNTLCSMITSIVWSLSKKLDAKILLPFNPEDPITLERPPGRVRYLILTGPCAFGGESKNDQIRLVCMTENSESTFWQYVAEKLELRDNAPLPSNSVMELSSDVYARTNDGSQSFLSEVRKLSRKNKVTGPY